MFRILILIILTAIFACSENRYKAEIDQTVRAMEEAWRSGDKAGVANVYSDDGYLLNADRIVASGRQAIDNYWTSFRGKPLDWNLETIAISRDFSSIERNEIWQSVSADITLWNKFDIKIPEESVFHFGRSHLSYARFENDIDTSVVEFLLVWHKSEDGYKIFLDSYN